MVHLVETASQPYVLIVCLNKWAYVWSVGPEKIADVGDTKVSYTFEPKDATCPECLEKASESSI